MAYKIGQKIRLYCTWTDKDGAEQDPTDLVVRILLPAGDETTEEYSPGNITKSDTGDYYIDFTITMGGRHYYRWEATGTVIGAAESYFEVDESKVV